MSDGVTVFACGEGFRWRYHYRYNDGDIDSKLWMALEEVLAQDVALVNLQAFTGIHTGSVDLDKLHEKETLLLSVSQPVIEALRGLSDTRRTLR